MINNSSRVNVSFNVSDSMLPARITTVSQVNFICIGHLKTVDGYMAQVANFIYSEGKSMKHERVMQMF